MAIKLITWKAVEKFMLIILITVRNKLMLKYKAAEKLHVYFHKQLINLITLTHEKDTFIINDFYVCRSHCTEITTPAATSTITRQAPAIASASIASASIAATSIASTPSITPAASPTASPFHEA